ncbi:MAG: hypothetical protein ACRDBO_16235 [Lachnospiraceae bacterium]
MSKIYGVFDIEAYSGIWEVMDKMTFSPEVIKSAQDSQDPELMLVDRERVGEFIDAYQKIGFSDKGRFVLMFVILDSFNDMVSVGDVDLHKYWEQIKRLLIEDGLFFSKLITYYASVDLGKDLEDAWHIAPYMRSALIGLVDKYENIREESDTPFLAGWDYLPDEWEDDVEPN